jgi:hypothetical protein
VASLSEFIQRVVTHEFAGRPLLAFELRALGRYLGEFDLLPNRNLDAKNRLSPAATPAARRGALVFREPRSGFQGKSCASCHPASSFFRDGLSHRLGSGVSPSPHAMDAGYETPTLLGLAESAPYFHDGRFRNLAEVVAWFDDSFELGLSDREQRDLVEYLSAVGAVDRPRDERPLALRLDHVFGYASLLDQRASPRVWVAAIDALLALLAEHPEPLRARVREFQRVLETWRSAVERGAPSPAMAAQAPRLRRQLGRLAADWAGALANSPRSSARAGVAPP